MWTSFSIFPTTVGLGEAQPPAFLNRSEVKTDSAGLAHRVSGLGDEMELWLRSLVQRLKRTSLYLFCIVCLFVCFLQALRVCYGGIASNMSLSSGKGVYSIDSL